MQVTVEVQGGPAAGKRLVLRPGQIAQVGRTGWADLSVPADPALAGAHFALDCAPEGCRLRDLDSSAGTYLNGARVREAALRDGDVIVAGASSFLVRFGDADRNMAASTPVAPAPMAPPESGRRLGAAALRFLQRQSEPLFAVLDAARDPRVLALLHGSKEQFQSLYEGVKGEVLAAYAPYLVSLPLASATLTQLTEQAWGESWGIFLTCPKPFAEVRKHFRHFLLVKTEEGEEVYFRFYDPRVLRVFLPSCTPDEAREFFGPISKYLVEADKPEAVLTFTARPGSQAVAVPTELTV